MGPSLFGYHALPLLGGGVPPRWLGVTWEPSSPYFEAIESLYKVQRSPSMCQDLLEWGLTFVVDRPWCDRWACVWWSAKGNRGGDPGIEQWWPSHVDGVMGSTRLVVWLRRAWRTSESRTQIWLALRWSHLNFMKASWGCRARWKQWKVS